MELSPELTDGPASAQAQQDVPESNLVSKSVKAVGYKIGVWSTKVDLFDRQTIRVHLAADMIPASFKVPSITRPPCLSRIGLYGHSELRKLRLAPC